MSNRETFPKAKDDNDFSLLYRDPETFHYNLFFTIATVAIAKIHVYKILRWFPISPTLSGQGLASYQHALCFQAYE